MKCRHGLTIRDYWFECLDCVDENNPEAEGRLDELRRIQDSLLPHYREVEAESARRRAAERSAEPVQRNQPIQRTATDAVTKLSLRTLIAIFAAAVLYPIVGIGGCIVRIPIQGHSNNPAHNAFFDPALSSFSNEAVFLPFAVVLFVFCFGVAIFFGLKGLLRILIVTIVVVAVTSLAWATIDTSKLRATVASVLMVPTDEAPLSGRKQAVETSEVISADKTGQGRTADEILYEFVLPSAQWVRTNLLIEPNQEVLIHHFASNEPVYINLAGTTLPPLQRAGTIVPLYTSRNCANDRGVKSKAYRCVQLDQGDGIKLFAKQTVRVGVLVKPR